MKRSDLIFLLAKGEKRWWDISAEEQECFIKKIKDPRNDIERSYAQYICQSFFAPLWKIWIRNIIAAVIIPFQVIIYLIAGIKVTASRQQNAIGNFKAYPEIVPDSLQKEFIINNDLWCNNHIMTIYDLLYVIKKLSSYCLHPYFCFKCIYNIANYSFFIKRYDPKAIICHAEFSCTSSILTDYCNKKNILHINVMHGEKLFYIRDSFFRYDRCYVWDKYYKDLFVLMRADSSQFLIEKPRIFSIDIQKIRKKEAFAHFKYYLQTPTKEELKSIIASMEFAKKQNLSVKYRLHPNHMNDDLLKLLSAEEIENPLEVDIETSIASCENVVGSYTTVLVQAFFLGINVIIDDVTYKERYSQLKGYKYILSNTNNTRLSEYQ